VAATPPNAVQAVAGWLTAHRQVPHGVACLLTLSWLLPYNCRHLADGCTDERGPGFVGGRLRAVCEVLAGPGGGSEPAAEVLATLVRAAGWSDRLGAYGLAATALPGFAAAGLRAANPVALDAARIAAAVQARA
jgi:alcohol dehydrogenase class IV